MEQKAFKPGIIAEQVETEFSKELKDISAMLIEKNRKYGNSVLEPVRIFSKASTLEQINVRIDDKLSRLRTSASDDTEDAEMDLIGYLLIDLIQRRILLRNFPKITKKGHSLMSNRSFQSKMTLREFQKKMAEVVNRETPVVEQDTPKKKPSRKPKPKPKKEVMPNGLQEKES